MKHIGKTRNGLLAFALVGAAALWATGLSAAEIVLKTGTSWNDKFPMKAMLKDVLKPRMEFAIKQCRRWKTSATTIKFDAFLQKNSIIDRNWKTRCPLNSS